MSSQPVSAFARRTRRRDASSAKIFETRLSFASVSGGPGNAAIKSHPTSASACIPPVFNELSVAVLRENRERSIRFAAALAKTTRSVDRRGSVCVCVCVCVAPSSSFAGVERALSPSPSPKTPTRECSKRSTPSRTVSTAAPSHFV